MTTESSANLLENQRQLAAEELCLKKTLIQIEEQINVLQVKLLITILNNNIILRIVKFSKYENSNNIANIEILKILRILKY